MKLRKVIADIGDMTTMHSSGGNSTTFLLLLSTTFLLLLLSETGQWNQSSNKQVNLIRVSKKLCSKTNIT
jgi:hypothetical protein